MENDNNIKNDQTPEEQPNRLLIPIVLVIHQALSFFDDPQNNRYSLLRHLSPYSRAFARLTIGVVILLITSTIRNYLNTFVLFQNIISQSFILFAPLLFSTALSSWGFAGLITIGTNWKEIKWPIKLFSVVISTIFCLAFFTEGGLLPILRHFEVMGYKDNSKYREIQVLYSDLKELNLRDCTGPKCSEIIEHDYLAAKKRLEDFYQKFPQLREQDVYFSNASDLNSENNSPKYFVISPEAIKLEQGFIEDRIESLNRSVTPY